METSIRTAGLTKSIADRKVATPARAIAASGNGKDGELENWDDGAASGADVTMEYEPCFSRALASAQDFKVSDGAHVLLSPVQSVMVAFCGFFRLSQLSCSQSAVKPSP